MMKRILSLAGLVLFAAIVVAAGPREIAQTFRGARPAPLLAGLLLSGAMVAAKSCRWGLLLAHADLATPLPSTLRYFLVGNFLGLATPGRVGDFAKALYLAGRGGNSFARASATIVVDRILDILVLALLAAAVVLAQRGLLVALPAVGVALLLPLIAAKRRLGERILRRAFERMSPGDLRARVGDEFGAFYGQAARLLARWPLLPAAALAALAYALMILGVSQIALGLGLSLPIEFVASSVLLAIAAALLPISVGGLGSREAVLIACFAQRGIPAETAVSFSLAFFAAFYLAPAAIGAILWQRKPVPIPSLK